MSYREFLLLLLAPLLALSAALLALRYRTATPEARQRVRCGGVVVAVLTVAAVAYTMPWDRSLIVHAVWWYPPGSVLGTIGLVPIEEYLFMIGQTLITGCWALTVLARSTVASPGGRWRRPAGTGFWVLVSLTGLLLYRHEHSFYAGAILGWFGPLLALHSAVGGDVLHAARRARLTALAVTPLLWLADDIAIRSGAWQLSVTRTLDLRILGLPVEEALFFVITNLLIVNSVLLVDAPACRARLARLRRTRSPNPEEEPCARSAVGPTML